nr:atherin-like [Aegilops tauschii subsp. strangulata]
MVIRKKGMPTSYYTIVNGVRRPRACKKNTNKLSARSTRPPTLSTRPVHPIAAAADRRPPTPSAAAVRARPTPPSPSQRRASPHLTVIVHRPDVKARLLARPPRLLARPIRSPPPRIAALRPRPTPQSPSQQRASPHLSVIIHRPDVKGPTCHAASAPLSPPPVADPAKHPAGGSSCTSSAARSKAGTAAVVERRRRLHRRARRVDMEKESVFGRDENDTDNVTKTDNENLNEDDDSSDNDSVSSYDILPPDDFHNNEHGANSENEDVDVDNVQHSWQESFADNLSQEESDGPSVDHDEGEIDIEEAQRQQKMLETHWKVMAMTFRSQGDAYIFYNNHAREHGFSIRKQKRKNEAHCKEGDAETAVGIMRSRKEKDPEFFLSMCVTRKGD